MSTATELTTTNFDETVASGVTLVDFWAEWCAPCKMMSPVIDQLAAEYGDKAKVAKINVDEEGDLAIKFDVSSIPTLLIFKDGQVAKKFVGVTSKSELSSALDAACQ